VRNWRIIRVTSDTRAPRAVLLSADDTTLFVADGGANDPEPRELRAYPVREDGSIGPFVVLHTFGRDYRGPHRGIEGMCLESNGNVVACAGWMRSGPGPMIYVFSPSGAVLQTVPLPFDLPAKCTFGDAELATLYVTTLEGKVYRIEDSGLKGHPARVFVAKE
jgi:gluconolactonase